MPVVRRSNDYGIEVAAFQKFSKIAKFFRCLALNGSYVFGSLVEDGRIDVAEAKPMLLQPMSPTRTLSFAEEVGFAADDRGADKIPDRPTPATNRDESERNCRREDLDLLISSGRPLTKVLSK